jgi:hypothetical protein
MLHNHTSASFAKRYDKPLTNNNRSNQIAKLHFQEFKARTYIKKSGFVMNYLCAFFVSPIWHCKEQIHNNVNAFVLYGTRVF